ncbi:MAG TPA: ribonuclease PH [Chthoniobacterales bacterium]|nr:ribonuclease PH [Chthoniobacterales bacterium]
MQSIHTTTSQSDHLIQIQPPKEGGSGRLRFQNRLPDALREIDVKVGIAPQAMGSVLISFGNTQVICAASIESTVPRWMKEQSVVGGWLTAEYSMLPYSTSPRKNRDSTRGKIDGRSTEIQRLIGRSLRAAIDLKALGARTLWVDCDVLQADGGTRTAAITGSSIAMALACQHLVTIGKLSVTPMKKLVAAVSVGVCQSQVLLDLDYSEDKDAEVDLNLVMNESLEFIEVQASGEQNVFSNESLSTMLDYGRKGIALLLEKQRSVLKTHSIEKYS